MIVPSIGFAVLGNEPVLHAAGGSWDAFAAARYLQADHVRCRLVFRGNGPHFPNAWLNDTLTRAAAKGLAVDLVWWIEGAEKKGDTSTVSLAGYRLFAQQLAVACRGRIRSVSIDNEPDAVGVDPAEYAARVAVAVNTWHGVDPGVVVIAGELRAEDGNVTWVAPWIDAQKATGTMPDRVSFHAYDGYRDRWKNGQIYGPRAKADWLRSVLVARGVDIPLWLTECGGPSAPSNQWTTMSEDLQAAVVLRTLAEASLVGVESMTWYRLADQADGAEVSKFGLFHAFAHPTGNPALAVAAPKLAVYAWSKTLTSLRFAGTTTSADLGPDRIGKVKR